MPGSKAFWAVLCCAHAAAAQHVVGARAGTVHFTVGEVSVDGRPIRAARTSFPLLKDGQELRTGSDGRVELLLGPGVFLRLAEHGALRIRKTLLEDTQVELLNGTTLVEVVETTKDDRLRIFLGPTVTELQGMGLYRFDANQALLRVFGGGAEVRAGSREVKAGRGSLIRLEDNLAVEKFDPKKHDGLHRWAARRSFDLFARSFEARHRRTHWQMTSLGWSWNEDFGMQLYSPIVAEESRNLESAKALDKAGHHNPLDGPAGPGQYPARGPQPAQEGPVPQPQPPR